MSRGRGGGSGDGPAGAEFETGVRTGDREVTISFDDSGASCPVPPEPAPVVIEPRFTG